MTCPGSFNVSRLEVTHTTSPKPVPASSTLVFGQTFTDHMLTIKWSKPNGWAAPKIEPYGPLSLDPSSTVLHYAPTLFEGMKAYKDKNGVARLFRPDMNMARMNRGAARLGFPAFEGEDLTALIKKLVAVDEHWIPTDPGCSLYIRPTMIGTHAALGVGASAEILLFVIMGPYYAGGFKPVALLASTKDVRAWPGGTGNMKLGANYAGGVVPQQQAAKLGYQQMLWLFGPEHQITEAGVMNIWSSLRKPDGTVELVTPPLHDLILPGVTRDSILSLARAHADPTNPIRIAGLPDNLVVNERDIGMAEIVEASSNGTLLEMFGSGTAAVVSAIAKIGYEGRDVPVPCGSEGLGAIAAAVNRQLVGIQTGEIASPWSVVVD